MDIARDLFLFWVKKDMLRSFPAVRDDSVTLVFLLYLSTSSTDSGGKFPLVFRFSFQKEDTYSPMTFMEKNNSAIFHHCCITPYVTNTERLLPQNVISLSCFFECILQKVEEEEWKQTILFKTSL